MRAVDVVVPCYRYGRYLEQCVDSVLSQQGVDVRVLVLDDASPDETPHVAAALCRRDARVHSVRHAHNQGHIATYNEGIAWADATYTLLLSADDYLLPGALHRAVDLLERHPRAAFAFGNVDELGQDVDHHDAASAFGVRGGDAQVVEGGDFITVCAGRNMVPRPTAVVRTALQKALGGYRRELPHTGDLEMWLRLAAHGCVGVLGATQAVYRRHDRNMSLAYQRDSRLPDLMERRAALRWFLERDARCLSGHERMTAEMMRVLALDAVSLASQAFNEGSVRTMSALLAFARATDPDVTTSGRWRRLALKRMVGWRAWRALRPLLALRRSGTEPRPSCQPTPAALLRGPMAPNTPAE